MATVQMVFSAHVVDKNGRSRSCHAYYQRADTTTLADLITALESFGVNIASMADGAVDRVSIRIEDTNWVPVSVQSGGAPIEQTALLNFVATGSTRRWALAVPAISNDLIVGDRINLTSSELEVILAEFVAGSFTNEVYQPLTAFADALVSFRRDRKQLQRASFERP